MGWWWCPWITFTLTEFYTVPNFSHYHHTQNRQQLIQGLLHDRYMFGTWGQLAFQSKQVCNCDVSENWRYTPTWKIITMYDWLCLKKGRSFWKTILYSTLVCWKRAVGSPSSTQTNEHYFRLSCDYHTNNWIQLSWIEEAWPVPLPPTSTMLLLIPNLHHSSLTNVNTYNYPSPYISPSCAHLSPGCLGKWAQRLGSAPLMSHLTVLQPVWPQSPHLQVTLQEGTATWRYEKCPPFSFDLDDFDIAVLIRIELAYTSKWPASPRCIHMNTYCTTSPTSVPGTTWLHLSNFWCFSLRVVRYSSLYIFCHLVFYWDFHVAD